MADKNEKVLNEQGEEVLTIEDTCTVEEIEESVKGFLLGDLTLAQLEGMTAENLYAIADMGYDLLEEGKLGEAQKIFEGLNVYNPYDSYFHSALGSIYQKQGKKEEAIKSYRAAVELYPEDITSWTNCGELLLERSGELHKETKVDDAVRYFEAAIECFKRALALDPKVTTPSALRARTLVEVTAQILQSRMAS